MSVSATAVDTDVLVIGGGLAGLVAALRVVRPEVSAALPARVKVLEANRPGGLLNWGGRNAFHIAGPKYKFKAEDWAVLMEDGKALGVDWLEEGAVSVSLAGHIKEVTTTASRTLTAHAVIIASGAFSLKNADRFRPMDGLVTAFGSVTTIRLTLEGLMQKTGRKKLLLLGSPAILELARLLADLAPVVLVEPPYECELLPPDAHLGTLERILGEPKIRGIEYRDREGALRQLECDTIYADFNAAMQRSTATHFLENSGLALDSGFVVTDRDLATNIPGVFAAGDVTGGMFAVSKSIYEGNRAGFSALGYLHRARYGFEPSLHPFYYGPFNIEIGVFHRRSGASIRVDGQTLEVEAPGVRTRYALTPELLPIADAVASVGGTFRTTELGVPIEGRGATLLFELVRIGVLGVGYGDGERVRPLTQ
jgi:thioredoxin reductase (NADPH)